MTQVTDYTNLIVVLQHLSDYSDLRMVVLDWYYSDGRQKGQNRIRSLAKRFPVSVFTFFWPCLYHSQTQKLWMEENCACLKQQINVFSQSSWKVSKRENEHQEYFHAESLWAYSESQLRQAHFHSQIQSKRSRNNIKLCHSLLQVWAFSDITYSISRPIVQYLHFQIPVSSLDYCTFL